MYTTDALSRLVTKPANSEDSIIPEVEMKAFIATVINSLPVSDKKLKEIVEAQEDDEVCKPVYTSEFRCDFRCDFLLLNDVKE